ncbi:MAG: glycosyltransferase family 4 protein [Lachnospiraceae bacterium]|nr:glycosyltransferase family 4 protein [Lachnospiraceae bacterium]
MIGHKSIPSRQGGVEIVVDRLASALVRRGVDVEAYNRRLYRRNSAEFKNEYGHGSRKYYNGIRIRCIPAPISSGYNAIVYAYLATIRALFGHYDVYHYHAEGPCVMLWLLKLFRKHIVVTVHGLDWQRAKWGNLASKAIMHGEKQAVKHADQIIVLSENVKEYFDKKYGRKTVYIPNGVDRHEHISPDIIRDKYGLKGRDYILFLARLVPEKGAHYLIDAFRQIDTDMKLVIAGGSGQADAYENTLHEMAAGDDRIIMTGFVEGQLLEELYSNAYIYVLPSDIEGMALSLLEAASYGNCCLVSDIAENTEVMEDHCVTFRHGDRDDLKCVLESLLADSDRVEDYRKSSADYICNKYSWEQMIDRTLETYNMHTNQIQQNR